MSAGISFTSFAISCPSFVMSCASLFGFNAASLIISVAPAVLFHPLLFSQSDVLFNQTFILFVISPAITSVTSPIFCLDMFPPDTLLAARFILSAQSTMSLANQTGSVFIVFAILSIVPYLFIIACCPSSVNIILSSQILLSSGFVAHLTFELSVFKKLAGVFTIIFQTLGLTLCHSNASGASIRYSQKLAV